MYIHTHTHIKSTSENCLCTKIRTERLLLLEVLENFDCWSIFSDCILRRISCPDKFLGWTKALVTQGHCSVNDVLAVPTDYNKPEDKKVYLSNMLIYWLLVVNVSKIIKHFKILSVLLEHITSLCHHSCLFAWHYQQGFQKTTKIRNWGSINCAIEYKSHQTPIS